MRFLFTCTCFLFLIQHSVEGSIPVLIFKSQRTGSGWMTSRLNHRYDSVFISEDVVNGISDEEGDAWTDAWPYIIKSFSTPLPTYGQNWEKGKKPKGDFQVLGSTVNAAWVSQYGDWNQIVNVVPELRLVLFTRTNKVKQAISMMYDNWWWLECVRVVSGDCKHKRKFKVKTKKLGQFIHQAIALDEWILNITLGLANHLQNSFYEIIFEEIFSDLTTLDRMLEWMGYTPKEHERCHQCSRNASDSLRDAIANYDEIESYISLKYHCLLPHLREPRLGKIMPEVRITCPDLLPDMKEYRERHESFYKSKRELWLKQMKKKEEVMRKMKG